MKLLEMMSATQLALYTEEGEDEEVALEVFVDAAETDEEDEDEEDEDEVEEDGAAKCVEVEAVDCTVLSETSDSDKR